MAKDAQRASDEQILEAAEMLLAARYPIALTGAGMSVESGIPPFRGPGGLWTKYGEPPMCWARFVRMEIAGSLVDQPPFQM